MFGAAVIAAMPKIVVKQIEELAPEKITPVDGVKPVFTKKIYTGNCMYLHDGTTLVGASTLFHIEVQRDIIPIEPWRGRTRLLAKSATWGNGYPQYIQGQMKWNIFAEKFRWIDKEKRNQYFCENKSLMCLVKHENIKLQGEVYLTEMTLTIPADGFIEDDIVVTGVGQLIVNTDDNTVITSET
jgi:hypothetical protein